MADFKSTVESGIERGRFVLSLQKQFLGDLVFGQSVPNTDSETGDNIVIVGGELFNKGAQAMTFTVVDEFSSRYPEKDIYLFSNSDYKGVKVRA